MSSRGASPAFNLEAGLEAETACGEAIEEEASSRAASKEAPADEEPEMPRRQSSKEALAALVSSPKKRNTLAEILLQAHPGPFGQPPVLALHHEHNHNLQPTGAGCKPDQDDEEPKSRAQVFQECAEDGILFVGPRLLDAMAKLDIAYADADRMRAVVEDKVRGRDTLDMEDFEVVVDAYNAALLESLQMLFLKCAGGQPGVPQHDVPELLRQAGVPPMLGVRGEELRHAEEEDSVDMNAFASCHKELRCRAGLAASEYDRLLVDFEARQVNGHISSSQFVSSLLWHESLVELAGGMDAVHSIVAETFKRCREGKLSCDVTTWDSVQAADPGKSPSDPRPQSVRSQVAAGLCSRGRRPSHTLIEAITCKENNLETATLQAFLVAARALHERVAIGLREVVRSLHMDPEGKFPQSALLTILENMGFANAMPECVEHFVETLDLEDEDELDLDQIYSIILQYCEEGGLSEADGVAIEAVFKKFDKDNSGTLESNELGPVIRWLGYQPSQYRVYDFAETFGLKDSSRLDILDFRKLAATYTKVSLEAVRSAFRAEDEGDERVAASRMEDLLHLVGYDVLQEEIDELVEEAGGPDAMITFQTFKSLELGHRERVRKVMEGNGGFTKSDLHNYKTLFRDSDPDCTGHVTPSILQNILLEKFPDTHLNPQRHKQIAGFVQAADSDGNGVIDEDEFCYLMQSVTEEIDREMLMKGLRVKDELGYSGDEVKQFRDLFHLCDTDMSGDIDFNELACIFGNLIEMDRLAHVELQQYFNEHIEGSECLSFWQFMSLMHKVQKTNWRNINGVARKR